MLNQAKNSSQSCSLVLEVRIVVIDEDFNVQCATSTNAFLKSSQKNKHAVYTAYYH